jgi:DNA-binding transcriptional MocR family regulator
MTRPTAAGLHAVVELPEGSDEQTIATAAADHGVDVYPIGAYRTLAGSRPPSLVLAKRRWRSRQSMPVSPGWRH